MYSFTCSLVYNHYMCSSIILSVVQIYLPVFLNSIMWVSIWGRFLATNVCIYHILNFLNVYTCVMIMYSWNISYKTTDIFISVSRFSHSLHNSAYNIETEGNLEEYGLVKVVQLRGKFIVSPFYKIDQLWFKSNLFLSSIYWLKLIKLKL